MSKNQENHVPNPLWNVGLVYIYIYIYGKSMRESSTTECLTMSFGQTRLGISWLRDATVEPWMFVGLAKLTRCIVSWPMGKISREETGRAAGLHSVNMKTLKSGKKNMMHRDTWGYHQQNRAKNRETEWDFATSDGMINLKSTSNPPSW